jgi:hypothetical protein
MLACRILKKIKNRGGEDAVAHIKIRRAQMVGSFKKILLHFVSPNSWCDRWDLAVCRRT